MRLKIQETIDELIKQAIATDSLVIDQKVIHRLLVDKTITELAIDYLEDRGLIYVNSYRVGTLISTERTIQSIRLTSRLLDIYMEEQIEY